MIARRLTLGKIGSNMKIKIDSEQRGPFLKALKRAESACSARSVLPILKAILITAEKEEVLIQTSNLDQAFDIRVKAKIEKEGKCAISAKDISRIADISEEIEIETNDRGATITGAGNFRLPVLDPSEFPIFPALNESAKVSFSHEELRAAIGVEYAMANPIDSRYILQGVCINPTSKEAVASDGKRLALSTPSTRSTEGWGPIIPDVACRILSGLLAESSGDYLASFGSGSASFESDNFILYTKLIEGNYPNFLPIIPTPKFEVQVKRLALIQALNHADIINSEVRKIMLMLAASTAEIWICGTNGEADISLALETPLKDKEKFTIGLDRSYLCEAVKAMNGEQITLGFTDELTPMTVRGNGCAVIMPMRIS
jgi:DNA polymerase III subunit beta